MTHDHAGRISRCAEAAAAGGIDGLVLTPGPDLLWLAGYDAPQLERLTALVVRAAGPPTLLVPALERPRAAASPAGSLLPIVPWSDGEDPFEVLGAMLGPGGGLGRRYAASDRMWATHFLGLQRVAPDASFVVASTVMAGLRSRKDPGEVALLERAARGADEAFARLRGESLAGRTERAVARALGGFLLDCGHESVSFAIVGSGPNGASPHHEPGTRVIGAGDAVVLDFGGRVEGYGSDITRTVAVGEPPAEVREVHDIVRAAQQAAFEAVAPGVPAQEIDRAARRVIADAGHGDAFVHRTGHGIGLEEHEPPYLVEGNAELLEAGMCFSIEPGIYLQGRFGVRIEDIVTVTADGGRRLNEAPRELVIVS